MDGQREKWNSSIVDWGYGRGHGQIGILELKIHKRKQLWVRPYSRV